MKSFILKLKRGAKPAFAAIGLLAPLLACGQPRLDVIRFSSHVLKNNPLHDPVVRSVAVFIPAQYTNHAVLPVVYYLPGYDSSSDDFIKDASRWRAFTQKLADEVTPVLLVVVDGRNRWGGSQYLNSPAQGNYADYVCDEIVARVESRYGITTHRPRRIIAGHSSGGFGALRLGMLRPDLFDGVIALSPDSDFPFTHLPLVQRPGVTNASLTRINSCMTPLMPRQARGSRADSNGCTTRMAGFEKGCGSFGWIMIRSPSSDKTRTPSARTSRFISMGRPTTSSARTSAPGRFTRSSANGRPAAHFMNRRAGTTIMSRNGCSAGLPGFSSVPSPKLSEPARLTLPPRRPNFTDMGSQPVVLFAGGEG